MNATQIATGALNVLLVCAMFGAALYMVSVAINRFLALFDPMVRARKASYEERMNRARVESRMPYRATTLAIAARNEEDAAEALIELTKQRAR